MRNIAIILCCFLSFVRPSVADQFDRFRVQCSSAQLAAIQEAVVKARELAQKAAAALPPKNSAESVRFRKWFGGPEGDYDPVVQDVYVEISALLAFQKFWCLPATSSPINDHFAHTNAFVLRKGGAEIFVGASFFSLASTGPKSRGGTLLHEMAHQSTKRKIGDHDEIYGPQAAKHRATLGPKEARSTADNFKYFAEDLAYGVP